MAALVGSLGEDNLAMLKPIVLRFCDDMPEAEFWTAGAEFPSGFKAWVFRMPSGCSSDQMAERMVSVFMEHEGMAPPKAKLMPAPPVDVQRWLQAHPIEAAFRL